MESDQGDATDDADAWSLGHLSTAIVDATRPIDSIRHQAKTITVGTSRSGYSPASVLSRTLRDLGIAVEDLPRPLQPPLTAVDDLLADVPSAIRYTVQRGRGELRLQTARKIGLAAQASSRFDDSATLNGTKLACIRRRQPLVVRGIRDNARLLVFPILLGGRPTDVVLLHLKLRADASEQQRRRFLEAFPQRAEQLVEHFEELLGRPVAIRELARFETEELLFAAPAAMDSSKLHT
jgi:glucosamine--fructose-6-phosphate aminotransferase (isomerizing)